MKTRDIKRLSPITWVFERMFNAAQYLSPTNLLLGTRVGVQERFPTMTEEQIEARTIWRSRRIEAYIAAWAILELAVALWIPHAQGAWRLLIILPGFRIFEIFQATINLNLFDRLRLGEAAHKVASTARTLILSFWNFIELLVCVGIFYSTPMACFRQPISPPDGYYFSLTTQLTIGYGDIIPCGLTKMVVMAQGLCGFLFALVVLSRLIAHLPETGSVLGDE